MQRVLILGCSGAGKSTLACRLGAVLQLPVIHMDREIWREEWTLPPREERSLIYQRIVAGPRWIIDGNWESSLHIRLPVCDTVILLAMPRWRCMFRVFKRIYTYLPGYSHHRPDMAPGCSERVDWDFVEWVWNFDRDTLPRTINKLRTLREDQELIILRTPREVEAFVKRLWNPSS